MTSTSLPDLSRSRAVLVGTWNYTLLQPVKPVAHSFNRMFELLTSDLCGWPAHRISRLPNPKEPGKLPLQLIDLFGDAEDVALFYYVGHGQSDHNGRLCLGLEDSRPEAKFRASTSLEFEHVRTALYHSNARTKIVILDCCFAGLAVQPQAALGVHDVADSARCDGTYTMAASAEYDLARYEEGNTAKPQTYFTRYLADIVDEGIGGHGEALTMQVIFHEISSRMRASRLSPPTQANRDNASMFRFSRNAAAVDATGLPPGVVEALRNPLPDVRGAVVSSLGDLVRSGDPHRAQAARSALRQLAERDPDADIRRIAGRVLVELTDTPTPPKRIRVGRLRLHRRAGPPTWSAAKRASIALVAVATVATLPGESAPKSGVLDRHPTGSDQQQIQNLVKPPPLPPGFPLPTDQGEPDAEYRQTTQCVTSLGANLPSEEPWGQARLDLEKAHGYATGENQTVAVIDTGVNRHDFLQDRLLPGGDYINDSDRGLQDCDGHGTEAAGIIAGNPPPGITRFTGVAPQAKILSIRQSSANYATTVPAGGTERSAGTLATLAQAIVNAANKNANVINISVNNCRLAGPITEAERQVQAALRYAVEVKDVVVVVPAGDFRGAACSAQNGSDPNHPAIITTPAWFSDYVISVAGVKQDGSPIDTSIHGPWVTVAAPGTDIVTLDPGDPTRLTNRGISIDQKAGPISGTAFASAYVAGLATLIRQYRPQLSAKQVINRIKFTAAHPDAVGGWNDEVGFGMINLIAALTAAVPGE